MKDDYNTGIYEAQEYHPGGYPQLRKKPVCYVMEQKRQQKFSTNMLWGLSIFGFASLCLVCLTVFWFA